MTIGMMDLRKQYAQLKPEIDAAVARVFERQQFRGGPEVDALEQGVADFCGARYGIGVSTGTDAILIALRAIGLQPGDEVITTPFTFFATAGATVNSGGTPIFVDIEPDTFNMDVSKLEALITERTKVLLPVHIFGQCVDMDPLLALAEKHNLKVVEDSCQSIGAKYKGRHACSMGQLSSISFYPSKNLGAAGEGGLIVGMDKDLSDTARLLRSHGAGKTYYHDLVGTNSHLHTVQAAVLLVKLKYLQAWNDRRRAIAGLYDEKFADLAEVVRPKTLDGNYHVWHQYVIRVSRRDEMLAFLREHGIECGVFYPLPLHRQKCFAHLKSANANCPEADRASREVLALPIYPEMTDEQVAEVANCIKQFLAK